MLLKQLNNKYIHFFNHILIGCLINLSLYNCLWFSLTLLGAGYMVMCVWVGLKLFAVSLPIPLFSRGWAGIQVFCVCVCVCVCPTNSLK